MADKVSLDLYTHVDEEGSECHGVSMHAKWAKGLPCFFVKYTEDSIE